MSQMCPNCGRDNRDTGKFCAHCQAQLAGLLGTNTILQGRYQIVGLLGCGGMGAVYLADDQRLGPKKVAVKENFDTSQQAQQQFEFEAHILANLDHPNLPKVTDHFIEPSGRQYLVMEYVEGEDLELMRQRYPQGQLPEPQVLDWADDLLDALTYLHTQPNPVIHRDIKPANIKLTPQGKLKLVDFGISKIYRPGQATGTGARASGSPGFAPVEQYIGGTDARSDIYSLGATLYCLLTGQVPPESAALASGQALTPPRQIRAGLSQRTHEVILRAMAVNAGQRFQTAAEMRRALHGGPSAPSPTPSRKSVLARLLPVGALMVGLVIIVAVGYLIWRTIRPEPSPPPTVGGIVAVAPDTPTPGDTVAPNTNTPTPVAPTDTPTITPTATPVPLTNTPTPTPTATPVPPTHTLTPTPTTTPIPPTHTLTPTPTTTPVPPTDTPTTTPTPTPTPVLVTDAGASATVQGAPELVLGEPWEVEGVSLVVTRMEIRSESDWQDEAAQVWFRFFNKMGQKLLVEIDWGQIHLEDSLGNRYVDWEGGGSTSVWIEPGDSLDFDRYYTRQPEQRSRVPTKAEFVQVVVDEFSRISDARWQMDINPVLSPIPAPDSANVKGVGEAWEQSGVALTLEKIEIRAESDWQDEAAQAWFVLTNHTDERLLVEIDFTHIYLVDSLGRRFSDWEGGGLWTGWVDPGKTLEFDRDYSEMAEQHSRITRGAKFVLVSVEKLGPIENVKWQFDIVR